MIKFKKVVVGISGGVDSAVAAFLLKKRGFDIQGVFMQNWDIRDEQGVCTADEDYKDAEYVCDKLNIPLKHVNFVKEYWTEVFTNLVKEYESGFTPNPDILCNRHIKFNHFYKYAQNEFGADAIATGHYAKTTFGPYLEHYDANKLVRLLIPKDEIKDQTFFLCQVGQEGLRKAMFPLADLRKGEVKKIAKENGLEKIAAKKESMGICFIGSRNFQDFISEYITSKPGDFIDIDTGKIVGQHNGMHHWTIGQRSRIQGVPDAYFIAKKNVESNTIYVAMGTKHPALYTKRFFTSAPHWIAEEPREFQEGNLLNCRFTFQHTQDLVDCQALKTSKGIVVRLSEDKRAITEGQYAVFYRKLRAEGKIRDGEKCLSEECLGEECLDEECLGEECLDKECLGEECLGGARIIGFGPTNFILDFLKNNPDLKSNSDLNNNSGFKNDPDQNNNLTSKTTEECSEKEETKPSKKIKGKTKKIGNC